MKRIAFLFPALLFMASRAFAGEFFEKDGAALRGYDPVAYFTDGKPVKGSPEFTAEHLGSKFQFASKGNRDAFVANPAKYATQYGGYCAYGEASGYKVATDPAAFAVREGKLYLNYDRDVQKKWSSDIPGNISKADANWPAVKKQPKVIE